MKIYLLIPMLFSMIGFFGCATLDSPVAKAVFNIAIRSAAYKIGQANPGSIKNLIELSTLFVGIKDIVSPRALSRRVNDHIDRSNLDGFQKQSVKDLASIAEIAYGQLYEKHKDVITDNQATEVLRAIGQAMQFGLVPSVDGPGEFVLESISLIVVVD